MNVWLPPFRICILKNDANSVQALQNALENNNTWEIISAETLWEAAYIATNCGLNAILLNDAFIQNTDINLKILDELRFFSCRKIPVPYLLIKTSLELRLIKSPPAYPLSKYVKARGIVNSLKIELANIESEMSDRNALIYKYNEQQFKAFIQGVYDAPGKILTSMLSEKHLFHSNIWSLYSEGKINEVESLIKNLVPQHKDTPFLHASTAIYLYLIDNIEKARKNLDFLVKENCSNPLLLYLSYKMADQYQDMEYQALILRMLINRFPHSHLTLLATGIWNCRTEKVDIGIAQLLHCLEKMPYDLVAASELIKALQKKKHEGLVSAIKNYAGSLFLKTASHTYMYTHLLGLTSSSSSSEGREI